MSVASHGSRGQCLRTGRPGWWSPLFKKGDRRVCSNYRGITLLSLPGKVYSRVLERRIWLISRTSDSGGTIRLSSWPWNTGPALYPPQGAQGFMGVCLTSPHVFCGLGEGIQLYGVWFSLPAVSQTCSQCIGLQQGRPLSPVLFIGVLFTSEGRMECEIDRRIGAAATVMRSLYRSFVVKRELS